MNSINNKNNLIQTYALALIDIICVLVSYSISFYIRYRGSEKMDQTDFSMCMVLVVLSMVFSLILDWNHFIFKRGYFDEFLAVLKYIFILTILLGFTVFAFRLGETFSRGVFGAFAIVNGVLTYFLHIVFKKFLFTYYKKSSSSEKIVLITNMKYVEELLLSVKSEGAWGYDIVGIVVLDNLNEIENVEGIPIVSTRSGMENVLSQMVMDVAFLYAPQMEEDDKNAIIDILDTMGVACFLSLGKRIHTQKVGEFAGHAIIVYENNVIDYRKRFVKRAFDIICSLCGLFIFGIIYPIVAILIKIDSPGPVIFKQQRIGRNGRRFYMYKFRSMYTDAEERKAELMSRNEVSGLMFKMENDPRVTRIGKYLRKSSLDEIPQFINIFKGDMSLIGTRPPTVEEFENYSIHYRRRLSITPGLTGMWQVSGRSEIKDFEKVVELDLQYIDNWSLILDMKILAKTVMVVLRGTGSK